MKDNEKLPLVSIILLNWNGYEDTIEALESLYQINYPNYNVILVDNNSTNDSINKILDYCNGNTIIKSDFFTYNKNNKPINVTCIKEDEINNETYINHTSFPKSKNLLLIENNENYGFAKGNNIGIKYTIEHDNPEYILLLNNDTVVDPDFLLHMVNHALTDPNIGIIGPKFYYYDFEGSNDTIWCVGSVVDLEHYPGHHSIMDEIKIEDYTEIIECDWVSGAGLLIKTEALPKDYLNTDFFFGCEDVDLAIQVKNNGYKVVTVLNSIIWHKTGMSRKKGSSIKSELNQVKTNLQFIKLHKKHYYTHLPIYAYQIFKLYLKALFN
ncbi:MAG: glycosyltransferase family 2 protein [Methanobacteriaceae archaeon]|nr:glycosyltransferase family 2 protein [Methanobacteriaceae archaeon]